MKKLIYIILLFNIVLSQGTWQWSGRTHPELKWRTLKTEHFNIHYHEGIEEIAKQGASISEQVLPDLMKQMGVESMPTIDITYTSEDEIMNGYALFTNMVFIWVDQNDVAVWLEDEKWLYQVTAHELQHIVLMNAVKSWMPEPFGLLFSGIPSWFVEGAAEYYTERWRPHRSDLSHKWHVLKQKEDEMDPHHDGFSKLLYLAEQFGDSTFVNIVHYRNKLKIFDFGDGFKKATGLDVDQFNEDWRRHMNTYYYGYRSQKELIREVGETFTLPVKSMRGAALSQDSLKMAIIGREDENQKDRSLLIFTQDTSKKHNKDKFPFSLFQKEGEKDVAKKKKTINWESEELDYGIFHGSLSWSPDGKQVAYSKYHFGDHQSMVWDIRIADVENGNKKWLTHSFRASYPDWSPDGKQIVFVAHKNNVTNLYIISSDGGTPEPLTNFVYDTQILSPKYSPDGSSLAYAKSESDGNLDIFVYNFKTQKSIRITDHPDVDYLPVWHPDGKYITFTSHEGSTPNLFTVQLETGIVKQITDVGDAIWTGQWNPKDSTILATTLSDVDSVRLVKVNPHRTPDTKQLAMRETFTSWRTHIPDSPLSDLDESWPVNITSDTKYRFTKHIKHLSSFVLPFECFEGMTIWTDAMGRHIFQGVVSTDWKFEYPSYVFSYVNAMSGPLWGIDIVNRIDFQYQTYNDRSLWEVKDGIRFWMGETFNFGNHTSSNHTILGGFRLHNRKPYWEGLSNEFPTPDEGKEGLLSLSYTWINRRPHKSNADLPKNGWGLNASYKMANKNIYGDFNYSRMESDAFINLPTGFGALFLRGRYHKIAGSSPPSQEVVGLSNDWTLYFPGNVGALLGPESMNPRGWEGIRFGEQAYMGTAEFRFPMIPKFPIVNVLGLSLGSITGALIADYGNAWDKDSSVKPIFTAGYEARISITVGSSPIVILSYGTAQLLDEWEKEEIPNNYLRFALINPF